MKLVREFQKSTRWMIGLHAVWLLTISLLAYWWGYVLLHQADRIAELERAAGLSAADSSWLKNRRMLFWESLTFGLILIGMSFALLWFYWQDLRKSRSIQMFFAGLSHELKTPLTSIRLQAETLSEQAKLAEPHQQKIDRLLMDTERLHLQLNKMLELARLERGSSLNIQTLAINDYLKKTLSRITDEFPQDFRDLLQIEFLPLGEAGVSILADPFALEILIRNTLDNIYRHCDAKPIRVKISVSRVAQKVVVVIRDNGTRKPESEDGLGRLFVKGAHSSGTGIGLYLTRQIMKEMRGTAHFYFDQGFVVELRFRKGEDLA